MMWNDGWGSWWAMLLMMVGMVAFWGLVIWGVVALVRGASGPTTGRSEAGPEEILAGRFARGEIEADEYERRLATLRGEHGTAA